MQKDTTRRSFIIQSATLAVGTALTGISNKAFATENTNTIIGYEQLPLPYAFNALEPAIDALTMEIHYGKHAAAYTKNMAEALAAEKVGSIAFPNLLANISKFSTKLRNNAGGHYNHELFWQSMQAPKDNNAPTSLLPILNKTFGSFDAFKTQFSDAAKGRFGSGWAWLIQQVDGTLAITSTANQDNPLMDIAPQKGTPLLGLDVWEHAYYLKYQNKRADYINAWWSVVNWKAVEARLK